MITIDRYRKTRFWAVYDAGELVCVTVYKKGANAVKGRLEELRAPAAPAKEGQGAPLAESTLKAGNMQFSA